MLHCGSAAKYYLFFSGANNLIPMEVALKIACKIKSNERFSVYIVIPMWPEGNPTEIAIQRILYWQVSFHKFPYGFHL